MNKNELRGKTVRITHVPNLEVGKTHECHYNAAMYAIENDCNFVCGWIVNTPHCHTPHCICEKDGEYIDPTLNEELDFKIFHVYTLEEIGEIFDEEGEAFIPFQGNYKSVYDGTRKLKDEELKDWWDYIIKMQFE